MSVNAAERRQVQLAIRRELLRLAELEDAAVAWEASTSRGVLAAASTSGTPRPL